MTWRQTICRYMCCSRYISKYSWPLQCKEKCHLVTHWSPLVEKRHLVTHQSPLVGKHHLGTHQSPLVGKCHLGTHQSPFVRQQFRTQQIHLFEECSRTSLLLSTKWALFVLILFSWFIYIFSFIVLFLYIFHFLFPSILTWGKHFPGGNTQGYAVTFLLSSSLG